MSELSLSVIVPTLNESTSIEQTLIVWRARGDPDVEIIVADGGSRDGTLDIAKPLADKIIRADRGRAKQMNAGAAIASANYLLFLHADTIVSDSAHRALRQALNSHNVDWGFHMVRLSNQRWIYRLIEKMMNWRSRFTRVATGDQCLFVSREIFWQIQGYQDIPLMEDVALCKRLRQKHEPGIISEPVSTSTRRWELNGVIRTVLLMWRLRLGYFLGVSPQTLKNQYRDHTT